MTLSTLLAQSNATADAGFALGGGLFIVFLLVAIVASLFWVWMLIDCLTSSLATTEKLVWVIVILFTHLLGALLYFFIARGGVSKTTAS